MKPSPINNIRRCCVRNWLNLDSFVVLVFNNNNYGTINRHQKREFPGRPIGTRLNNINFAEIAKAMGAEGYTVNSNEEFAVILQSALNAGCPAVIDIKVSVNSPGPWDGIK